MPVIAISESSSDGVLTSPPQTLASDTVIHRPKEAGKCSLLLSPLLGAEPCIFHFEWYHCHLVAAYPSRRKGPLSREPEGVRAPSARVKPPTLCGKLMKGRSGR